MKKLFVAGVKAAIRNDKGQVLVLERTGRTNEYWDLPGGSVEHDVSFAKTLINELEQELPGIKNIMVRNLVATFDTGLNIGNIAGLMFIIHDVTADLSDPIRLSREHRRYHWLDTDLLSMESLHMICGQPVGAQPSYLNYDQWDAVTCHCLHLAGHSGAHSCGEYGH